VTSVSSATANSGRGLPGELNGKSNNRVSVGAVVVVDVEDVTLDELSSPMAVESKLLSPDDIPLGEVSEIFNLLGTGEDRDLVALGGPVEEVGLRKRLVNKGEDGVGVAATGVTLLLPAVLVSGTSSVVTSIFN